jgi:NADH:ubiquinone reductase (H+-translocating)
VTSAPRPNISRGDAVVSAGRLQVRGFPGWCIWLFIHIAFLTGYRNRVGALLTWWLAFTRDVRRERAFTTQQIETLRDVYASSEAPAAAQPPGGREVQVDRAGRVGLEPTTGKS